MNNFDDFGKWGLAVLAAGWLLTLPVFIAFFFRTTPYCGRRDWREFWICMACLPVSWAAYWIAHVVTWHIKRKRARARMETRGHH